MKVVVFSSQKGGVGKSTLAINLALEAARTGAHRCAVLDMDPQGSAVLWAAQRSSRAGADGLSSDRLSVLTCRREGLRRTLEELRAQGYSRVFIDLPPLKKNWLKRVFQLADLVVLPLRPGFFDMVSGFDTWQLVEDRPVRWVINGAFDDPMQPDSVARVVQAELGKKMLCLDTIVTQAPEWVMSAGAGQGVAEYATGSRASAELSALWNEIERFPEIVVKHRYG